MDTGFIYDVVELTPKAGVKREPPPLDEAVFSVDGREYKTTDRSLMVCAHDPATGIVVACGGGTIFECPGHRSMLYVNAAEVNPGVRVTAQDLVAALAAAAAERSYAGVRLSQHVRETMANPAVPATLAGIDPFDEIAQFFARFLVRIRRGRKSGRR